MPSLRREHIEKLNEMTFQNDPNVIHWKLHLKSSPEAVDHALSTDDVLEPASGHNLVIEQDGVIHFVFPNQAEWKGKILENDLPHRFKVEYYGGSITEPYELNSDGSGGTDRTLTDQGVPGEDSK